MAIKSAASTMGTVVRIDQNALQIVNKQEALKMLNTGDIRAGGGEINGNRSTVQSNRDGISVTNNLQRS